MTEPAGEAKPWSSTPHIEVPWKGSVSEEKFIDTVDPISQDRLTQIRKELAFSPIGDWVRDIKPDASGEWILPHELPSEFVGMFNKALAHEATLYPNLANRTCHLSIRLIDAKTYNDHWLMETFHSPRKEGYTDIHFDQGSNMSTYLVGSGPTTIFYGELPDSPIDETRATRMRLNKTPSTVVEMEGVSAKSARPWHIFRIDDQTLHSQLWGKMDEEDKDAPLRLIVRMLFTDTEQPST